MSIFINKFIDRLAVFRSRNAKEFVCPMREAEDLHRDISKLLLELTNLQTAAQKPAVEDIQVVVDGAPFRNGHK